MRSLNTRELVLIGIMIFLLIITAGIWGIQKYDFSLGTLVNEWLNYKKKQKGLLEIHAVMMSRKIIIPINTSSRVFKDLMINGSLKY